MDTLRGIENNHLREKLSDGKNIQSTKCWL